MFEESLEQCETFGSQDSFDDLNLMIEQIGIGNTKLASNAAESEVAGAENHGADAGVYQCAGAHRARLQRDVERSVFEAVIGEFLSGLAQRQNFGVRGRIVNTDRRIGTAPDNLVPDDDNGANGHLALFLRAVRLVNRFAHITFVVHRRYIE